MEGEVGTQRVLAEASGFVAVAEADRVTVVDRQIRSLATAAYVLFLIALITDLAGAALLTTALTTGNVPVLFPAILLAVGVLATVAGVIGWRALQERRRKPLSECRLVAVFDLGRGVLLDAAGHVVAPLPQVSVRRRLQVTSSSPNLFAISPHGSLLLASGNPFLGGLGRLPEVLRSFTPGH